MSVEALGYVAGSLTTICFIPQAIRVVRDKSVQGVSLPMYALFSCGVAGWIAYGVAIKSPAMIIFNTITLGLSVLIVFHLVKYGKKGA